MQGNDEIDEVLFPAMQDGNRTQPMSEIMDARVDVCLWFLETPFANDVWSMVQLSTCIPVIPILAKVRFPTSSCCQILRASPIVGTAQCTAFPSLQRCCMPSVPY